MPKITLDTAVFEQPDRRESHGSGVGVFQQAEREKVPALFGWCNAEGGGCLTMSGTSCNEEGGGGKQHVEYVRDDKKRAGTGPRAAASLTPSQPELCDTAAATLRCEMSEVRRVSA